MHSERQNGIVLQLPGQELDDSDVCAFSGSDSCPSEEKYVHRNSRMRDATNWPTPRCCRPPGVLAMCLVIGAVWVHRMSVYRGAARFGGQATVTLDSTSAPTPPSNPVLHFLFLAIDDVPHAELWRNFFVAAPAGSWSVWLHCRNRSACNAGRFIRELPQTNLVPTVPAKYCADLVSPEVQLLRYALNGTAEFAHARDKFLVVSDSTLPLKPFSVVLAVVTSHAESDFCIYPAYLWRSTRVSGGARAHLVLHSQFVQLSRRDARALVAAWGPAGPAWSNMTASRWLQSPLHMRVPNWDVPVLDGSQGNRKQVLPAKIFHDGSFFCTDEVAPFSAVFGALVLNASSQAIVRGFGTLSYNWTGPQGRCFTYCSFRDWSLDRKLQWALQARDPSEVFVPAMWDNASPFEFGSLSNSSLQRLRASPFLFARKFKPEASLPGYNRLILRER